LRLGIFVVMAGRQAGGPETYEVSLVRSLAALDRRNEYHVFCLSRAAVDAFHLTQENLRFHVLRPAIRWISIPSGLPLGVLGNRIDLLHATFVPPPVSPTDYVFTMHCLSSVVHPEFYRPTIRWRLNQLIGRGLKKAKLVLCVSKDSRDQVAERFKVPEERLAVVHNGVSDRFRPVPRAEAQELVGRIYGVPGPYLLYVGRLEPRKNIGRLLAAFHRFRLHSKTDLKLVLAGRRTEMSCGLDETIERLNLKDSLVELGYVDEEHLPALYSAAELFLFPTLWEGFGIPVLEAMACGTPVVTSNRSSLPEVAGDAAVLADPYSVEELADCIDRVCGDSALRAELRRKGLERAKLFSWQRTAQETLAAYQRAQAS